MKPSEKQIKVIEFLEQQLKFWKHTNDIGSPTHTQKMINGYISVIVMGF